MLKERYFNFTTTDKPVDYYYAVERDVFVNSDAWFRQDEKVDRIVVDAHLTAQDIDYIFNEKYGQMKYPMWSV